MQMKYYKDSGEMTYDSPLSFSIDPLVVKYTKLRTYHVVIGTLGFILIFLILQSYLSEMETIIASTIFGIIAFYYFQRYQKLKKDTRSSVVSKIADNAGYRYAASLDLTKEYIEFQDKHGEGKAYDVISGKDIVSAFCFFTYETVSRHSNGKMYKNINTIFERDMRKESPPILMYKKQVFNFLLAPRYVKIDLNNDLDKKFDTYSIQGSEHEVRHILSGDCIREILSNEFIY